MRTSVAYALGLSACLAASLVAGCATSSSTPTGESGEATAEAQAPSQAGQAEEGYLEEGWSNLTLQEQKTRYLVEGHIAAARQAKSELRLEDAELELTRALELEGENAEARELYSEVLTLLGRDEFGAGSPAQRLEELYVLRKDQAEADARQNLAKAKVLRDRGEYDAALAKLTLCIDIVTLSPYSGNWTGIETEAKALLETVRGERDQAITQARQTAQRKAREELQRVERQEQEHRQNVMVRLLDQAVSAFQSEDYDEAIALSDRVLRLDPRNEMALDVRDTSFRRSRDLVRTEFLQNKRKQYARWQEEQEELRIPYQGVMLLPDIDKWNEITERRAGRRSLGKQGAADPGELELRAQLARETLPGLAVDQESSLTTVAESIQLIASVPIVVDPEAENAASDEGVEFDIDFTYPLSVEKALNVVAEMAGPGVTWTIRHETVLFTTVEKAAGDLIIHNHDVSDITFPLRDFLGPRIDQVRLVENIEDDDGGSPFGSVGDEIVHMAADKLGDLIQSNIAPTTWDGGLEGVEIRVEDNGSMIVTHTEEVQQRIRQFLEDLRHFRSSLVTIESKFMTIREGFIQEIGVDWRGLDGSQTGAFSDLDDIRLSDNPTLGLDNSGNGVTLAPPSAGAFLDDGLDGSFAGRTENLFGNTLGSALSTVGGLTAQWSLLDDLELSMILNLVEKSTNAEIINEQVLSVSNRQRAYVTVVNQRAYVQDFDVEVAQFQAIADPVINTLIEGIVLDVRPTIDNSRKYLTLEIQPTVTKVISLTDFSTTLAGQTAAVTLQLPEVETQSVFTTAVVPDGGSILLGGLSRLRDIERRAEVPFLAKIPVLGFFFKEEGYNDERESLMIMLRAWITDTKEEFETL